MNIVIRDMCDADLRANAVSIRNLASSLTIQWAMQEYQRGVVLHEYTNVDKEKTTTGNGRLEKNYSLEAYHI